MSLSQYCISDLHWGLFSFLTLFPLVQSLDFFFPDWVQFLFLKLLSESWIFYWTPTSWLSAKVYFYLPPHIFNFFFLLANTKHTSLPTSSYLLITVPFELGSFTRQIKRKKDGFSPLQVNHNLSPIHFIWKIKPWVLGGLEWIAPIKWLNEPALQCWLWSPGYCYLHSISILDLGVTWPLN